MPDLLVDLKVDFPLRFGAQKGQPESQNRSTYGSGSGSVRFGDYEIRASVLGP